MTEDRDPYQVLGIGASAGWALVRAAYRDLARRYHADGSSPNRARMVEINAAYDCLERRQRASRSEAQGAPVGSPGVARWPGAPVGAGVPVGPGVPAGPGVPVGPGPIPPPSPAGGSLLDRIRANRRLDTPVVDFGQYAGWRIAEIAERDPRYLRWLSRHSSGHRYRAAIEQVLGPDADIGRKAALVR